MKHVNSGLFIGGCTLLGMAAGWFFGEFKVGLFAGIGIGLILSAFMNTENKNDDGQ